MDVQRPELNQDLDIEYSPESNKGLIPHGFEGLINELDSLLDNILDTGSIKPEKTAI